MSPWKGPCRGAARRWARSRSIRSTERSPTVRSQQAHRLELARRTLDRVAAVTRIPSSASAAAASAAVARRRTPHDRDLHRAEAEVLPGLGVLDDVALLAPVGLLHQRPGRSGAWARRSRGGPHHLLAGGDPAHDFDPVPVQVAAQGDRAERGAVVVPARARSPPWPPPPGNRDHHAAARRRAAPSTLLPGVSAGRRGRAAAPPRGYRWPGRSPGEARITRASARSPRPRPAPAPRPRPGSRRRRLGHPHRGQHRGQRRDAGTASRPDPTSRCTRAVRAVTTPANGATMRVRS